MFSKVSCNSGKRIWRKVETIRADNGGEYILIEFKEYCTKHGIRLEKTVLGTPQHNEVAEQMNRTIVKKVRCMLKMAKLSKSFGGRLLV